MYTLAMWWWAITVWSYCGHCGSAQGNLQIATHNLWVRDRWSSNLIVTQCDNDQPESTQWLHLANWFKESTRRIGFPCYMGANENFSGWESHREKVIKCRSSSVTQEAALWWAVSESERRVRAVSSSSALTLINGIFSVCKKLKR